MIHEIKIRGAREHNLQNIDVSIPRERLVVVTGPSGSGKSSLARDTLYAEGHRRYVECLSADARHYLQQVRKPDVDGIEGLPPAIYIDQRPSSRNPRSTVGTVTEVVDFLRLLFSKVGVPHCVACGRPIRVQSLQQMADRMMELPEGTRVIVLAPLPPAGPDGLKDALKKLERQGFLRVRIDGTIQEIGEVPTSRRTQSPIVEVVVDRLALRTGVRSRMSDSIETAARLSDGLVSALIDAGTPAEKEWTFSERAVCKACGVVFPEISPRLFSFNSPEGACPACTGLGKLRSGDPGLDSDRAKQEIGRCMTDQVCPDCGGSRLNPRALAVRIHGTNIGALTSGSIRDLGAWLERLDLTPFEREVMDQALARAVLRVRFLEGLGLGYLSLDREVTSLSGGEAQRVHLATHIGSGLVGVLYILDEPTLGLHAHDTGRLLDLLRRLRDRGNTVLVVEHDRQTIAVADLVLDMGPGAGADGGRIVFSGTPDSLSDHPDSVTAQFLSGRRSTAVSTAPMGRDRPFLLIKGARVNNLRGEGVRIPVGRLTCVTGVSGSGKSSLVLDALYPELRRRLGGGGRRSRVVAAGRPELEGVEFFDRVVPVDQTPLSRSPRSNPATYTGIFSLLRDLFVQLPEARRRGYGPSRFSFNVKGGRCEVCRGEGLRKVEMYFLPDVFVVCDLCQGRRYNRETLEVRYRGQNIAQVLEMTVAEARGFFEPLPQIVKRLEILNEVGLGYMRLGQPANTLSGGEAQRVKLARELARWVTGRTLYILDEPTTGLHFVDIERLLLVLGRLTDAGNTVVVIEHNLDVMRAADWIVDLGPGAGEEGGRVMVQGPPAAVAACSGSLTGRYLAELL